MKRTGIYIEWHDLREWKRVAEHLGYGPKSKYKLLRKLLAYAQEHPAIFQL